MSVHHKYTKDFKEKIENLIKFIVNPNAKNKTII